MHAQAKSPMPFAHARIANQPSDRDSSRPVRVLIAEDEAPIRKFVERVLGEAGYSTVVATNGVDALEVAVGNEPFDILVTDLMMPQMNGDELARRLRRREPSLKVLYFTGYADSLFSDRSLMWEDEAFLEKPCSPKGLVEAVSLLWSDHINQQAAGGPVQRQYIPAARAGWAEADLH
jgi:two-component system cell cycle sensor histidine kinase/response regulator CckA